jgi:phage terminase large subunit
VTTLKIDLPDKLLPVFTTQQKDYRGAYGGRGGAKTIAFATMAVYDIMRLSDKPWKFLCGRELQKSLKDSVFSVIEAQIKALGVESFFEIGKEFIRCKNGNEFLFYGLRTNIAEVKGLHGVRRTWLEEAQKVSQSSLTYLTPTVMRDFPDCELWASWNPEDEEDPIHKLFVTDADDRTICAKINWYDNPWFPESLNKVRLRDKINNKQRYDWIWEGSFNLNTEASVYGYCIADMERQGRIKEGLYDSSLPVHTSWDIGYSDDTPIWFWQQAGNEVRLIDYHESNRKNFRYYSEQIWGREIIVDLFGDNGKPIKWRLGNPIEGIEHRIKYKYGDHFVPHDAVNKLLQAGGRSAIDQLYDYGIKARKVNSTTQKNQIDLARLSLESTWIDPVMCREGLRSLRKYQFRFNENKGSYSDEPDHDLGGYSHACDAYEIIGQVWKSKIISSEGEKPKFFQDLTAKEIFYPENDKKDRYDRI